MERAAEVVCEILHAPHTRGAALRALGELRTSHPEAAFHLEPFDQLSGAPPTSTSAAPPAVGGASSAATHAPAPPEDSHLLGGDGGGRGWQCVASGALLGRSEDPMLRACAEVAAADADTARMLFEPALHGAARQVALSRPLAAAVHAALRGVEAMPRRAAVVLDALARLYFDSAAPRTEARPGLLPRLYAARDAHSSTPPARAMPSTPELAAANAATEAIAGSRLWEELDLLALAEAAAALHAHPTALLFLELHRSRAPQQPPRPPAPSQPSPPAHVAEEARQRALLSWLQGGGNEGGASSPAPWRRPEVRLALLDAPDTRDVAGAHRSLQRLGAHVLLRASLRAERDLGATQPAERARRAEAAHEAAWRLGQWGGSSSAADTLGGGGSSGGGGSGGGGSGGSGGGGSGGGGGGGGGGGEDAGSGCHSAILGALRCVGSGEGGAIDSAMRAVGGAQAKVVTVLRGTHREAGGVARPLLIQLQLLATVRDGLAISQGGTLADGHEAAAGGAVPRDAREQLLAWLSRRWSDQLAALEPRQEASHTEPVAALHAALLQRLHAPPAAVSRVYVEAARVLRRAGDRTTARNLLCRAAEHLRGGRTDSAAGADAEGPGGWARRWQLAKLLYSQGGAMSAEAIRVASRLRRELGEAPLHAAEERGLRLRLLRTLGCWLEEQKADGRAAIEEVLQRASLLTDAESGAEDGKPTYALARFYETQYTQLARDTASSSYRQLRSRAKATRAELASTAAALAVAEAALPKGKQTRKLKSHLQTLERKVILDDDPLEGSGAVERYLSSAVQSYWLVLTHAPHAAPRRCAHAAAALVRLWLNNAHDASLSKEVLPRLLPPARPPNHHPLTTRSPPARPPALHAVRCPPFRSSSRAESLASRPSQSPLRAAGES